MNEEEKKPGPFGGYTSSHTTYVPPDEPHLTSAERHSGEVVEIDPGDTVNSTETPNPSNDLYVMTPSGDPMPSVHPELYQHTGPEAKMGAGGQPKAVQKAEKKELKAKGGKKPSTSPTVTLPPEDVRPDYASPESKAVEKDRLKAEKEAKAEDKPPKAAPNPYVEAPGEVSEEDAILARPQHAVRTETAAAKYSEPKGKKIELEGHVAAAVFAANTNETGYAQTIGSHHATKVNHGLVRVEIPPDGDKQRQTLVLKVPETVCFDLEA